MSRNILFEHNRRAYTAAISMMEQTGKAAVVHPTGTGKSFIAFQLCADHPDQKICWLSPSAYIFETQKEKWCLAGGILFQNIYFLTYARLMRMKEEEFIGKDFDYLVLDEFHRLGATQWGTGVERFRKLYPDVKILGLSATNIRYLDNQRDMAWELFGGNIASELTLGAAIVQGILPAPKYVLSVYSYQQELKKYEARVHQTRNRALREKAEKELEALRRALDRADGLPEIFARHMNFTKHMASKEENFSKNMLSGEEKKPKNKYIVFCANYEHLLKMRELALEWFASVDPVPHIYTAYSDDPMTAEKFKAFQNDRSDHLQLLYCIDMLNEGIHIDGLSGVILLRPTVSPTIYKQQIGRALAAGGKNVPVIFDIVMNIENLLSVGAIEEEVRESMLFFQSHDKTNEIVNKFRIIDEVKDCRTLFLQLNETLTTSWNTMYTMAKKYYESYGNLEIPAKYTMDGYSLGAWISTQRKVYLGKTAGCLSREQVERLAKIGMRWQGTQEAAWEKNFAKAEKYFKKYGNLEVPADFTTEDGCKLGRWVRRQRDRYKKIALASENKTEDLQRASEEDKGFHTKRIERLTRIGMVWKEEDPWEKKFTLAKRYYEEHGNLRMATDYVVEGVWLSYWLREQRTRLARDMESNAEDKDIFKDLEEEEVQCREKDIWGENSARGELHPLSEEQKQKLASIGIQAGVSQAELSWKEQYDKAEEFYRKNGNLSIPKRYVAGNGKNLGIWLQHQREGRRKGMLANWQVRLLDGIGMIWESGDPWEQGFSHAIEYFRENGDLNVPNQYSCVDGYRLGKWISNQRFLYGSSRGKEPGEERIQRLNAIGMIWSAKRGRRSAKKDF